MNDNLSEDDKLELDRRRSAEMVTEAVEAALKRRYTWVGIIVALAAFLGSTVIIKAITADLETQIAVGSTTLERIDSQAVELDTLADNVRRKLAALDAGIEERIGELDLKIEGKSEEVDTLYSARNQNIDNLESTLAQVEKLNERVDELAVLVERLSRESANGDGPELDVSATDSLEDLRSGQKTIREQLVQTSAQIRLSKYSVYVHVAGDQAAIDYLGRDLGNFLSQAGYVVPKVQSVAQKSRSIRYFHEQDREGALLVLQSVQDFLRGKGIADLDIEVRDFTSYSGKKPRVGVIELWLYR